MKSEDLIQTYIFQKVEIISTVMKCVILLHKMCVGEHQQMDMQTKEEE